MTEETRFCKDCVHFEKGYRLDFCVNPSLPPNVVSGGKALAAAFCRNGSGRCGREGRYYEERRVVFLDNGRPLWRSLWRSLWRRDDGNARLKARITELERKLCDSLDAERVANVLISKLEAQLVESRDYAISEAAKIRTEYERQQAVLVGVPADQQKGGE